MRTWTNEEVQILIELYPKTKYSVDEIAKELQRSTLSILNKALLLHLTRGVKRWKKEYDELLKERYQECGAERCAEILGYSPRRIYVNAKRLGLTKELQYWTPEEIGKLKELCDKHSTLSEIAKLLNKPIIQINNKLRLLNLKASWWSYDEIEYLKAHYNSHNAKEIGKVLNRTKGMIYRKASDLDITQKDNSGSNHYAFKEDKREYPAEWTEKLRRKIRKRDDYQCMICGKTQQEEGIALSVHHIDYDKENNKESNLITLCLVCHAITNVHRSQWTLFFISLMKEKKMLEQIL